MCEVTLTGLTRLETSRLRFELGCEGDPFVDTPITLEGTLAEVIDSLRSVSESLYPAQPGELVLVPPASSSPSPSTPELPRANHEEKSKREPKAKREKAPKSEKTSGGRGYVNWHAIAESLVTGEIDEYVCTQKATSANTTKGNLLRRFPGLDVDVEIVGASANVTVQLGDYDPEARAHA